jgi:hypothetical protein
VSEVSSPTLSQKQDEPFSTAFFLFRHFLPFYLIVRMSGNQMVLEINANQSAFSNKADPCVKESYHFSSIVMYFIYSRMEGTSSSVCDVDRYFIIRKSVDYIFSMHPVFTLR